ncbi:hypothetical protein CK203_057278 [Vitis vinifera]|uniref:Uncharacterized protein n=1 Tax=Vitis vinifera TaxID=29760 RepID=A0A438GPQ4_VITVI|nr:hypothetical protein CK203_057278 [Vitis vinifera]
MQYAKGVGTPMTNADWAFNPDDHRSTSGFCAFLGSGLVSLALQEATYCFLIRY